MDETAILIESLAKKEPLAAMLAPSFPIVYDYPQIIGKLKRAGFNYVVEVAAGAKKTNQSVMEVLTKNPKSKFITSPCPSMVRLIRQKYPQLKKYLALAVDSPMIATAKIVKKKYPECHPVFIGHCIAKKFESGEDYPDMNILVLTYRELDTVFEKLGVKDGHDDINSRFDIEEPQTRIYPMSGGLAATSGATEILAADEYMEISGWQNHQKALEEFANDPKIRLLDVLFCDGGCVNGPGIDSNLNLEQRRQKVVDHWKTV